MAIKNIENEIERLEALFMTYAPDRYIVTQSKTHKSIHIDITDETDIFYSSLIKALIKSGYRFYVSTRYKRIVITGKEGA